MTRGLSWIGARSRRAISRRRPQLLVGCVAAGLGLAPSPSLLPFAAIGPAAITGWAVDRRHGVIALALVLGGGVAGVARLDAIDRPARAAPPGAVIDAEATLLERPRSTMFGSSAPMRIDSGHARGLRVLARVDRGGWPTIDTGTRFHIRGFVRTPPSASGAGSRASAPGASALGASAPGASGPRASGAGVPIEANAGEPGTPGFGPLPALDAAEPFDYAAFLRSRGIGRELRVERLDPIGRRGGVSGAVDSIRRRAERGIGSGLSPELAALARGMVLGEDGDLSEEVRDDFRRSGLAHLLAASGQNVALLCALALPLLILAGTSPRTRVAVLLPLVGLYVALAGSGASVARAGVMAAAGLIALGAGRPASALHALMLAAAVTLGLNPRASADPGWQLSFAAVGGMLALGPWSARMLKGVPRLASEALGATVAATLATSPLLAHQFGAVSIAALPANVVVFPAVAPVMWIGMGQAALAQIAAVGAGGLAVTVTGWAGSASALGLRWIEWAARRFGEPGWAQADVRLGWPGVLLAYAAIGIAVAAAIHAPRLLARLAARRTGRVGDLVDSIRAIPRRERIAAAAFIAASALALLAFAAPAAPPRALTVDFIDVGQGDATLIRDSSGAAVLFDGGPPEGRVDRTLKRLGVRRLSVVVATHQSRDHHGGLLQVIRRFPVGLFLDGGDGTRDPTFLALEREADRRRIPRRFTRAGESLAVGGMRIRILWPPPRSSGPAPSDPNPRATIAVLSHGGFDLFLSADAESRVAVPLRLPRVEAMKLPHHGSEDTALPELLRRLRPSVAAIEVGRGNSYGHPRRPTLDALRGHVPRVYRTDRDGTVELTVSGGGIAIRTHR